MIDINLLPPNLRQKKNFKTKKDNEESVFFVHEPREEKKADALKPQNKKISKKEQLREEEQHLEKREPKKVLEKKGIDHPKQPKAQLMGNDQSNKNGLKSKVFKALKPKIYKLLNNIKKDKKQKEDEIKKVPIGMDLLREDIVGIPMPVSQIVVLMSVIIFMVFLIGIIRWYYVMNIQRLDIEFESEKNKWVFLTETSENFQNRSVVFQKDLSNLEAINTIFKSRMDWISVLTKLESLTLKSVYYKKVNFAGESDTIQLLVRAKNMEDAVKQIRVFRKASDFISQVSMNDFDIKEEIINQVSDEDKEEAQEEPLNVSFIEFPLQLTLNPAWFEFFSNKSL